MAVFAKTDTQGGGLSDCSFSAEAAVTRVSDLGLSPPTRYVAGRMICGLVMLAAVAACVTEAPTQASGDATPAGLSGKRAAAYETQGVAENLAAFRSVCLIPEMSPDRAKSAAKAADVSVTFSNNQNGMVTIGGTFYRDGRLVEGPAYVSYGCNVNFRGAWADQVLPEVQTMLQAAGYRTVAGFKRESYAPSQAYDGQEVVQIKGTFTRGGETSFVIVKHSPPGSEITSRARITYISNTLVSIATDTD